MQIPDTGWSTQTITKTGVQMSAGRHVLRVVAETNAVNGCTGDIDNLVFVAEAGSSSPPRLTPSAATASGTYTTNAATNAIDGNTATSWVAGGGAPQWIQLDLGQSYNLGKVRLGVNQDPAGQTVHEVWGGRRRRR